MCSNRQVNLRTADSTGRSNPNVKISGRPARGYSSVRVTVCAAVLCHAPLVPSPKNGGSSRQGVQGQGVQRESKFPRRIKDVRLETYDFYTFESLPVSLARWSGNQP